VSRDSSTVHILMEEEEEEEEEEVVVVYGTRLLTY